MGHSSRGLHILLTYAESERRLIRRIAGTVCRGQ